MRELRELVACGVASYNERRLHASLGYDTPASWYFLRPERPSRRSARGSLAAVRPLNRRIRERGTRVQEGRGCLLRFHWSTHGAARGRPLPDALSAADALAIIGVAAGPIPVRALCLLVRHVLHDVARLAFQHAAYLF